MIAPYKDFIGKEIAEGDIIVHPSGEQGVVLLRLNREDDQDRWIVDYGDGVESRLCLQVGDRGRAVRKMNKGIAKNER